MKIEKTTAARPNLQAHTRPKPPAQAAAKPAPKKDSVEISKEGQRLADHADHADHAGTAPADATALTDVQAKLLGDRLVRIDSARFESADVNEDDRLSAAEAKAAGLQ